MVEPQSGGLAVPARCSGRRCVGVPGSSSLESVDDEGQALMAFPTGKGPPEEGYFHRVTFDEGRAASGLRAHMSCSAFKNTGV